MNTHIQNTPLKLLNLVMVVLLSVICLLPLTPSNAHGHGGFFIAAPVFYAPVYNPYNYGSYDYPYGTGLGIGYVGGWGGGWGHHGGWGHGGWGGHYR